MVQTIDRFLEDAARRFEERPALSFKPGFRYLHWSYRDVWEGAGRVASLLQRHGVRQGRTACSSGGRTPRTGCSPTSA